MLVLGIDQQYRDQFKYGELGPVTESLSPDNEWRDSI